MNPIKFKGYNTIFGKWQPEYMPLPAFKEPIAEKSGTVVTCWRLSFWERLRMLLFGRVYVMTLTFHSALQPLFLTTENPVEVPKPVKRRGVPRFENPPPPPPPFEGLAKAGH